MGSVFAYLYTSVSARTYIPGVRKYQENELYKNRFRNREGTLDDLEFTLEEFSKFSEGQLLFFK